MKVDNIGEGKQLITFSSLADFYTYISTQPTNTAFEEGGPSSLSSIEKNSATTKFTGTKSFDEAVKLLKDGWPVVAKELTNKIKAEGKQQPVMQRRNILGAAGHQAIVPLYLQNTPNNMMATKNVAVKQKVVTINKSIAYSCAVETETIIAESVKAIQIVNKLESQGYRVNLNVIVATFESKPKQTFVVKVRIKSANEKLNISKLAFPLANPSMLRRLFLRFIEVYPPVTKGFVEGYGAPIPDYMLDDYIEGEYIIPKLIKRDITTIKTLADLSPSNVSAGNL